MLFLWLTYSHGINWTQCEPWGCACRFFLSEYEVILQRIGIVSVWLVCGQSFCFHNVEKVDVISILTCFLWHLNFYSSQLRHELWKSLITNHSMGNRFSLRKWKLQGYLASRMLVDIWRVVWAQVSFIGTIPHNLFFSSHAYLFLLIPFSHCLLGVVLEIKGRRIVVETKAKY